MTEQQNEEQRLSVTTDKGYVRVIAGAGSGKTLAMTQRFAFLENEMDVLPESILCVTAPSQYSSSCHPN